MTPLQAADALRRGWSKLDEAVCAALDWGAQQARGFAMTTLSNRAARGQHSNVMRDSGHARLFSTIQTTPPVVLSSGHQWRATVTAGGAEFGVFYARIQEFGGKTRPHVIVPRNAAVLAFEWPKKGAGVFFFAKVDHPGSDIPARPYLRPAVERVKPLVAKEIKRELLKRALRDFAPRVA